MFSQFQDIFKSSEDIWNKKQLKRPDVTPSLSAVKSVFNISNKSPAAPVVSKDYDTNTVPANYNINSAQAIEGFVNESVERTRLESERIFLNQHVFEATQLFSRRTASQASESKENASGNTPSLMYRPLDSYIENIFAKKMEEAVCKNGMDNLLPFLKEAVQEVNDPAIQSIWDKIFAICREPLLEGDMGIDQLRASKIWMRHIVKHSTEYLQNEYKRYMEGIIEGNLERAKRGGIPGTLSLIEAFLNVAHLQYGRPQNENFRSHPVWCVLFHALRLGDYKAASEVSRALSNVPSCAILVSCVNNISNEILLDHSNQIKLSAEWNHEEKTCTDIYKKAVYGLLLDFDCVDVNDSIENWIWAKLTSVKFDTQHDLDRFQNVQRLISIEYGEDYFMDEANGGNTLIYFSALLLSGQLERAIEILQRFDMPVFATHLAIIAYSLKLLVLTDKVSDPLFVSDPTDPTLCKFNFARIIILYVKKFEMTHVSYALNYCFFLNKFYFDSRSSEDSSSLFEACVSRLVYVSGQADAILGKLNTVEKQRMPGLLDRFENYIEIDKVISRVALDTSLNGDNLGACSIYCLGGKPNEAIKLMNRQLSVCIISSSPQAEYSIRLAEKLERRYGSVRDPSIEKQNLATLNSLIRCYHIFRLFKSERYQDVVNEAEQALIIPLDPETVSLEVERFKLVAEEIRNLLPDLSVILMQAVVKLYENATPKSPVQLKMQKYAKAILLYSAMIPFRFPTAINSKLLQLQAQVS